MMRKTTANRRAIRGNHRRTHARPLLTGLLLAGLLLAAALGVATAAVRSGTSHAVTLDAVTAAGGASQSATYRQTVCAVGQAGECGALASASYRLNVGLIQYWGSGTPASAGPGAYWIIR